jgi:acetoin utilization protein AcuC
VLTVSIHQYLPGWFFPGTGDATERGGPGAEGTAVNVPLPPGTGDDAWLEAFRAVVPDVVGAFGPDVLVTQLGCDTHASDPLAQLRLTTATYRTCARELHGLAHEAAAGRWIATGGGGYRWASVVPRAWTLYFAEMAGALDDLPDALPESFIEEAEFRARGPIPATFSEPGLGPGPADDQARAVAREVRELVVGR